MGPSSSATSWPTTPHSSAGSSTCAGGRPLTVVVDAGNGMGGHTVPAVLGDAAGLAALPLDVVPLYFELDGTFPNHEANPLEPGEPRDLQHAVVEHGADLGLAFDGDADRCFVIDELGEPVSPSAITAMVAGREIAAESPPAPRPPTSPLSTTSSAQRTVAEVIARARRPPRPHPGRATRSSRPRWPRPSAVFGGEHSAHYYFRDFWFADTGMLAALHVLAALGEQDGPLSALMATYSRYAASGEINSTVTDVAARHRSRSARGRGARVREFDELDGLTVTHAAATGGEPMWWFNLRASNTEPLLRLNVEAADEPPWRGPRRGPRPDQGGVSTPAMPARACRREPRPGPQAHEHPRATLARARSCAARLPGRAGRRIRPAGPELQAPSTGGPTAACAYRVDDGVPVLLVDEASASGLTGDGHGALLDEPRLDDQEAIAPSTPAQTLRALATAGAQVRRAMLARHRGRHRPGERWRPAAVGRSSRPSAASAVVSDVLDVLAEPGSPVPVTTRRNLPLPGWVGPLDLVVAVHQSGRAAGPLALAAEAARRGACAPHRRGRGLSARRRLRAGPGGPRRRGPAGTVRRGPRCGPCSPRC